MSLSPKPIAPNPRPIDAGVSIGHVHLKVADLNRAIAFYCGVLDLMQRYGHDYPTRAALADALRRLIHGISIEGASDHGVSEALYLRDPEKNGIEPSWDRAKAEWPLTKDGHLEMETRALDTRELSGELTP
jgi:catechol 2,3-dioxygenase